MKVFKISLPTEEYFLDFVFLAGLFLVFVFLFFFVFCCFFFEIFHNYRLALTNPVSRPLKKS